MSPILIHASTHFLQIIADAAARSIVLGCFVAACLAAFRVKFVTPKLLAWRGALLAALAMPLLILVCPAISLPIPALDLHESNAVTVTEAPPTAVTNSAALEPEAGSATRNVLSVAPESGTTAAPAAVHVAPTARHEVPWTVLAVGAYLAIALALAIRVLIGIRFGKRLEKTATPVDDLRVLQILSAISVAANVDPIPRLAESEMLSVPLMLGVREPVVLLPADWRKWDADEFAAVLAHEVSHVKRHDALVQRLALIHRAIFWFSPLGWWLERRLADLSEQASDEAALAGGADRTRYAETLLGFFAELEAAPERVWWQGVSMAKTGQAEKRVERILGWRSAMSSKWTKALIAGLAVCAAPVVALTASVHPSLYRLQEQAVPAPAAPAAPLPPQVAPPVSPAVTQPPLAPLPSAAPPPPIPVADLGVPVAVAAPPAVAPMQQPVPAPAPPPPPAALPDNWEWASNYRYWPWGPRFVIVTPGSSPFAMSGSEEDAQHAESLRSKIPGDFIWFEHDEKSYIIRDQATIGRAKQLWATRDESAKEQEALRKKEDELGKKMREEVQQKMQDVRVKIPDMTAELQKLQDEVKSLNASGATMQQLGDLQREVGELQQELGQTRWQSGGQMSGLEREGAELGQQMGDLGRQIGEIARKQMEESRQAADQMKQLLDDAIAKGLAKPE